MFDIVTIAHQKVSGIELKDKGFHHLCSDKYTIVEKIVRSINITNKADIYSILCFLIQLNNFVTMGILSMSSKILNTLNILKIENIV